MWFLERSALDYLALELTLLNIHNNNNREIVLQSTRLEGDNTLGHVGCIQGWSGPRLSLALDGLGDG